MMKPTRSKPSTLALVKLLCRALDAKKAEDLRVLDVSAQSSITDFLVLANGTSEPHLRALRVELEKVLDAAKVRIVGIDTDRGSGWLVVDAFEAMVHIFTPAMRAHYRLENLWKDATELSVPELLDVAAPKKRGAVRRTAARDTPKRPRAKRA
jgi:ribosome-associated protein